MSQRKALKKLGLRKVTPEEKRIPRIQTKVIFQENIIVP